MTPYDVSRTQCGSTVFRLNSEHDDVIKWKHFPRNWPFVCAGNSPVNGEFPAQRPVTRNFDVFFNLRRNKWLSVKWWGWWFETPSRLLWRQEKKLTFRETDSVKSHPMYFFIQVKCPCSCRMRRRRYFSTQNTARFPLISSVVLNDVIRYIMVIQNHW